jgi:protein-tyrosine-phosphatase
MGSCKEAHTNTLPHSILFVCTGNIFRNLMAEYAMRAPIGPEQ